jgi:quercetin 2,3-dioxygenase
MMVIRKPEDIFKARGEVEHGTFSGRWHYSFDSYYDPKFMSYGNLRVFNDDTLSPGAVWPLHPHQNIEVVTYCAGGEFQHADEHGEGAVLKKGWVQHTSVGRGMWHSEINHRRDSPMRFIQMWFIPQRLNLDPSVEYRRVEEGERSDVFFPLVSNTDPVALKIFSDAEVFSSSLHEGHAVEYPLGRARGVYLYVVEGGPVQLDGHLLPEYSAAQVQDVDRLRLRAQRDTELLLVDTRI